ncbi:rhamnogalacturonan acetylesterase [Arachidicoccus soli]|uniref:Rhamnogalacturonan acetylesterase n=1 Tax=Arachidicoccus soli TaxID=2341117 RepID=A0A386HQT0_9BACT|nr:rhamnogalacturonan acetylesterase [Arachidicoccus soli]AYD48297.1 rhamnogalacturonan acetylesterase [Arachidicoccus soli]
MKKFFIGTSLFFAAFIIAKSSSAQAAYKFDFGTGKIENGYKQVTATNIYSDASGYGFDYGTQAIAINRGGDNALTSDFCTSIGSMFFSVKLPQGNYKVTVHLGDKLRSSITTIKAESRRLMSKEVITKPGEFKTASFIVSVWDSTINAHQVVRLKPREVDKLDWDNKLTLEFSNARVCLDAIEIQKVDNVPTVFLTGNSTVTDQQLEPWACWGQMFPSFFDSNVAIADMAASGETLRSSFSRKRLAKVASMLKAGDYLFIEFAHNDQKKGSGEEAYTTYNKYLKIFIDSARAHQAIPVLVTSTCRHDFDKNGKVTNTLGEFPAAMRYEAKKDNVTLIDLNKMTETLYNTYGEEKSKALFVQFPAGTFPGQNVTLADNTHFNDFGAYELAKCMVEGVRNSNLALKNSIKKEVSIFNPSRPDNIENWDLPFTPMFTSIKPYGN